MSSGVWSLEIKSFFACQGSAVIWTFQTNDQTSVTSRVHDNEYCKSSNDQRSFNEWARVCTITVLVRGGKWHFMVEKSPHKTKNDNRDYCKEQWSNWTILWSRELFKMDEENDHWDFNFVLWLWESWSIVNHCKMW